MSTELTIKSLFEAGTHFGHNTRRWNPHMKPFIYGKRDNIYVINLAVTYPLFQRALEKVKGVASRNGRILFVGTKHQAKKAIRENALRCAQYYVDHRWLGGMLTNWETVSNSVKRLKELKKYFEDPEKEVIAHLTKKELLSLQREHDKLECSLGGIKDMGNVPDLIFVVDTNKEHLAVKEAQKLKIPLVAILDTNSDPMDIDYPVPGNDDSMRAIELYCRLVSDAVLEGIQESLKGGKENLEKAFEEQASVDAEAANKAEVTAKEEKAVPVISQESDKALEEAFESASEENLAEAQKGAEVKKGKDGEAPGSASEPKVALQEKKG